MARMPPFADLTWTPEGAPRAEAFDDVYFSRAGGLAETDAVFLAGCGLPEAWRGRARFTILELGFGAGLNVLAAWRAWRIARAPGAVLHVVSIESAPLRVDDAARAHAAFPEIADLAARLRGVWPVRAWGPQRIWFEDDGFALTVIHDDALEAVRDFEGVADAVFLDGFAPARNAAMWSQELMHAIAARCAPGARAATYSVAGHVRRALEAAGFTVEKKPGFAHKRERLEARLTAPPPRTHAIFPRAASDGRVAIVGAGIAGACLADALRRRGRDALVLDAGAGASNNPAALVMPRLDRDAGPIARLHLAAYLAALRFYESRGALDACGVLELARDAAGMAELLADPPLPEDVLRAGEGGAWHARAGMVHPPRLIEDLLGAAEIRRAAIAALVRDGASWSLRDARGAEIASAQTIVLAAGARIAAVAETAWLPVRLSRGQIEWAKGPRLAHAYAKSAYAAPCGDGLVFGATFDAIENDVGVAANDESRARNLASLRALAPHIAESIAHGDCVSHAGVRATTPDRSPLLGLMPDSEAWLEVYKDIAFGRTPPDREPPFLKGVYAFGGLGARGFTLAPLLAESLASEICGEPDCISKFAREAIHPARFLLRALKRRENIIS